MIESMWKDQVETTEVTSGFNNRFPSLDLDKLLEKIFPGYKVDNKKIKVLEDKTVNVEVSIYETLESNPISLGSGRTLLITKMTGIPHFYGNARYFLSVFDTKGKLITSPFIIPKPSEIDSLIKILNNLKRENGAFFQKGFVQFVFYNCKGYKYILLEEKSCVTAMCYGSATLYKFEGRKFVNVQEIRSIDSLTDVDIENNIAFAAAEDVSKNIIVIPEGNKVSIYQGKRVEAGFVCPTECIDSYGQQTETMRAEGDIYVFYKDLFWDVKSCKFE